MGNEFITRVGGHFQEPLDYGAIKQQTQQVIEKGKSSLSQFYGEEAQSLTVADFLFMKDGAITSFTPSIHTFINGPTILLFANIFFVASQLLF